MQQQQTYVVSRAVEKNYAEKSEKQIIFQSLIDAFAGANIPLHTRNNASLKSCLESNITNVGCIPSSSSHRRTCFLVPKMKTMKFHYELAMINDEANAEFKIYLSKVYELPATPPPELSGYNCDNFRVSYPEDSWG